MRPGPGAKARARIYTWIGCACLARIPPSAEPAPPRCRPANHDARGKGGENTVKHNFFIRRSKEAESTFDYRCACIAPASHSMSALTTMAPHAAPRLLHNAAKPFLRLPDGSLPLGGKAWRPGKEWRSHMVTMASHNASCLFFVRMRDCMTGYGRGPGALRQTCRQGLVCRPCIKRPALAPVDRTLPRTTPSFSSPSPSWTT